MLEITNAIQILFTIAPWDVVDIGQYFDVLDHEQRWCEAIIDDIWYPQHILKDQNLYQENDLHAPVITRPDFKATNRFGWGVYQGRIFKIHYFKYSIKQDEYISEFAPRFAPHRTKARRARYSKPEEWICSQCTFINQLSVKSCVMCFSEKDDVILNV